MNPIIGTRAAQGLTASRNPNRRQRRYIPYSFTLIELLIVIAIIAIVVASKAGFFLQFSAIFAFKAL